MKFAFLIGMIVNPIVLGFIFFGFLSPIAVIFKIFGRDELKLAKFKKNKTSWEVNETKYNIITFRKQF